MEEEEQLFHIDIECDEEGAVGTQPDYYVDHVLVSETPDEGVIDEEPAKGETCWNCDNSGHTLRECPEPFDRVKVANAKKKFMRIQSGSKRYCDDKFVKFRPGHISDELRDALGIDRHEIPRHVYMMRVLGYPPGWLLEAKITNSGIKMYNDRGKRIKELGEEDGEILTKMLKYDIEKFVEFPGFNVVPGRKSRDNHRQLGFPSMRDEDQLESFIRRLEESANNPSDQENSTDDEPCDMEMSEMLPTEIIEEVRMINRRLSDIRRKRKSDEIGGDSGKRRRSDDGDLEEGELDGESSESGGNENGRSTCGDQTSSDGHLKVLDNDLQKTDEDTQKTEEDRQKTDKDSQKTYEDCRRKDGDETPLKRSAPIDIPSSSSPLRSAVSFSYGTPNVKNHSPYSSLPAFGNFNKDISDVIDFENLPDSVGKYETMCTVISKIRSYMTSKTTKK